MKMSEYIVVRTRAGLVGGTITNEDEDTYTLCFGERTVVVQKKYVYLENDVLFVDGKDIE